jgi:signal transduction histidine kinase
MGRSGASIFSRRLLIASIVFGVFVLCDILLFGFLIFRSLSQREIERVLLETRAEAKDLANRIAERAGAQQEDLYFLLAYQREVLRYIDSDLARRDLVETVEIYDQDGKLIFRQTSSSNPEEADKGPKLSAPAELPGADNDDLKLEVREAIGNLGTLRIGISPAELRQRTEVLRHDLIRQMVWIGIVGLAVLASAYAIIWLLLTRARRLEEQAQEADRMAYIGTLAAGLAHEIRNPLNSLNLNMQLLEEEVALGCEIPSGRRLLSITRSEISRLERLVTDFLLYARPRPLDLEEVAPGELLMRAREVLVGEVQARGVRLRIEEDCAGALLRVDPGQMTQLLLNLTQNALAATEETPRPEVVLGAHLAGHRVVLSVADNGAGIRPEDRERIFEIFYSTRKGGTGLGLAVVERIARAHGGEIEVESEPGRGTKVSVSLPMASLREEAVLEPEPEAALATKA